ncbi:MAG: ester cyclase [Candidatus Bathyarchaeota archaeon]|nr:ester cyclase [Candidatus Bathyarchaeota archaeon]MDH5623486.1 ester cyclase [Candidatus Bathyarchaeota archaeon]MDH5713521.1 ester cyclase [Candidatus Bathyarchaeota archaeon]
MSAKENKALVRRFFEESNKGKAAAMAVIDELCATNIVYHGGGGEEIRGLKDYKQSSESYNAFPDLHFTIDDMVAEGDKVAVRFTLTGTHKGEFMGRPPTNKKLTMWVINIYRVVGGKFVEGWERSDTLGSMQQLGVVPTPKKEK